jgi:hypothetical protein
MTNFQQFIRGTLRSETIYYSGLPFEGASGAGESFSAIRRYASKTIAWEMDEIRKGSLYYYKRDTQIFPSPSSNSPEDKHSHVGFETRWAHDCDDIFELQTACSLKNKQDRPSIEIEQNTEALSYCWTILLAQSIISRVPANRLTNTLPYVCFRKSE